MARAKARRDDDQDDGDDRVRLDKWLWAARFFKTRSLAAEAIDGGRVDVNGERAKRARVLVLGDEVRVRSGPTEHVVVVRALSGRRGSASVAAELFEETAASREARERMRLQMRAMNQSFAHGAGKPGKKERRQLSRFDERYRRD